MIAPGPVTRATVFVRMPRGRFPAAAQTVALQEARPRLVKDTREAFDKRHDPATKVAWKARLPQAGRVADHPLLVKSGRLKAAAVKAAESATVVGGGLVMKVPTPKYGAYHMTGTKRMARRRWLGVSRALRLYLARRLAAQGLRVFRGRGVR